MAVGRELVDGDRLGPGVRLGSNDSEGLLEGSKEATGVEGTRLSDGVRLGAMDEVGPEVRVGLSDGGALAVGESLVDGGFEG